MGSASSSKGPVLFRISATGLGIFILPLPTIGFITCVLLSIWKDYEASTWTHCGVKNYLPSISSAIGGYTPQRYIWRICIALHSTPRLMCAIIYYNQYLTFSVTKWYHLYRFLILINLLLNIVENFCLVLLSYVSSTENYEIHETSFIIFLICSQFYMLLQCILFSWSRSKTMTNMERKSLKLKIYLFVINIVAIISAGYFFYRHMDYCEAGIYSMFALCEYTIVIANIAFHGQTLLRDHSTAQIVIYLPQAYQRIPSSLTFSDQNLFKV